MIPNLIIPVLNRYDLLQRLLDSIDFPIGDLLIIDNGGQVQELRFPDFVLNSHILPLPSNLGGCVVELRVQVVSAPSQMVVRVE